MTMPKKDIELDDVARVVVTNTETIAAMANTFGALLEVTRALLCRLAQDDPYLSVQLLEIAEPVLAERAPELRQSAKAYLATIDPVSAQQMH